MLHSSVFYVFGAILMSAALRVITARNPVHAALFLVLSFFTAAALWILLYAEFLAIALVLVYVGAVMVLFLFVVMMLDINFDRLREGFWKSLPVAAHRGRADGHRDGAGAPARGAATGSARRRAAADAGYCNTRALGRLIYTDYVYPLRDRRRDPAGGDRRGDRADVAQPQGDQVPGSALAALVHAAGPAAHREDAVGDDACSQGRAAERASR